MCSPVIRQFIEEVVAEKVGNQQMFTAFEVSLAVKEKCKAENEPVPRHSHIRGDVHREIRPFVDSGQYVCELRDVGAPAKAFLYGPHGCDFDSYVPLERRDKTPSPAAAGAGTTDTPDNDTDTDEDSAGGSTADSAGRLHIRTDFLRQAGFAQGQKVYVRVENVGGEDELVISGQSQPGKDVASYTVDRYTNIKLSTKTLAACGLNPDATFDFNVYNQVVIVSTDS